MVAGEGTIRHRESGLQGRIRYRERRYRQIMNFGDIHNIDNFPDN